MEKFAHKIEHLIQEEMSLYDKIYALLLDEKAHVVNMKVEALWETTAEKKAMIYRVEVIHNEIAGLFKKYFPGRAAKMKPFSLSHVIGRLNILPEKKRDLENIILSIKTIKQDISRQAVENSKFISENLSIINGIFATIMDSSEKEEEYNQTGDLLKHESGKRLFNAQV